VLDLHDPNENQNESERYEAGKHEHSGSGFGGAGLSLEFPASKFDEEYSSHAKAQERKDRPIRHDSVL
jgi:hypothetical protein